MLARAIAAHDFLAAWSAAKVVSKTIAHAEGLAATDTAHADVLRRLREVCTATEPLLAQAPSPSPAAIRDATSRRRDATRGQWSVEEQQWKAARLSPEGRPSSGDTGAPRHGSETSASRSEPGDGQALTSHSPVAANADANHSAAGHPPATVLIDTGTPTTGQMLKQSFLAILEPLVVAAANQELGPAGTASGCPYLIQAFAKYRGASASAVMQLLRGWIPSAGSVATADELIPLVLERVRSGVRSWRESGALPAGLAAADPALAAQANAAAPATHPQSLDSLEAQLGPGSPADGRVAEQMSRATGQDYSGVRVHTGSVAAAKAAEHDATAFAVGRNVVMGANAPAAGTTPGDALLAHELAHTGQQAAAAADPAARKKPIGDEDQAAEADADRAARDGLARLASFAAAIGDVMRTGLQLQRCPQQTPKDVATRSVGEKAAFIRKSAADSDEGWGRVVVDVFEQTDPGARIALQRQLDMEGIVAEMPDFEATRLGTLGPLTAGQATLNKKRAAYIEQVINDFGDRAEVFVLFALRGVYDDDASAIFTELASRQYLHKLLAMPEVAAQVKARGIKTDGFHEHGPGFLGAVGGVLGGLGAGLKHMVKDDRPGKYQWQKAQLPDEYAGALSQMEMAEFEGGLTPKNVLIGAIDQVTFGVPHGVVDLGRSTVGAIGDLAHGDYRAAGENLSGAAVVLLTHLGVKAWKATRTPSPGAPAPSGGAAPVDNTPGLKGPQGPGQFVIPNFEGPITAQEAKLGSIFQLNPEAQAAMGRLIARVGRAGVQRAAEFVQANSRAALFVAENGEAGVYALLEADGDAAVAETKLPKRQLGPGAEPAPAEPTVDTAVATRDPIQIPAGLDKRLTKVIKDVIQRARNGKLLKAGNYHPHFDDATVLKIIEGPDAIYQSEGKAGRLLFRRGNDIVVVEGPGSAQGNVFTGYGPSGIKGDSGAAALGGVAGDSGAPVTDGMITSGTIPVPKGRPSIPKAVQKAP